MNKPWGRIQQVQNFELMPFTAACYTRSVHPHYLSVYASTADFSCGLIRQLQHSILGPWLAFTQAGITPASHQTISSPHVHAVVIRRREYNYNLTTALDHHLSVTTKTASTTCFQNSC